MDDIQVREEISNKWHDVLKSLRIDYNKWEKHTLKDYIIKCAEIIELQIEYDMIKIDKSKISSHLYKELIKEDIDVSDRYVREVLPDVYKRNYSESELNAELHESDWSTVYDGDELIERDQYDNFRINGKEVKEVKRIETREDDDNKKKIVRKHDEYTKCLGIISRIGNTIERLSESMIIRYSQGHDAEIKSFLTPLDMKTKEYLEWYAKLSNAKNHIDERNKWGEYEKLIGKFLIEVGATIAKLAKKMGYSTKYGSIGVLRNPDAKEFVRFLRSCPACKKDIDYIINENIELYKRGKELKIDVPLEGY